VWVLQPAPEIEIVPADPLAALTDEQKASLVALLQGTSA
jgi:hypothetical protein